MLAPKHLDPDRLTPLWPALVADIGGTNARFAMIESDGAAPSHALWLKNADYPSLPAALRDYLDRTPDVKPRSACLAVAGPIDGDLFRFSNIAWEASQSALAKEFDLSFLRFVNDFEALAMSVPILAAEEFLSVGGGHALDDAPIAVIGPGTGLGVASLMKSDGQWRAIAAEGGHTDFAAVTDLEIEILKLLRPRFGGRVSSENILSGPGIAVLHDSLAQIEGRSPPVLSTAEIIDRGTAESSDLACAKTLELFCRMMGGFAGNVALITGARGGVVLGGGILPRLQSILAKGDFRARFEAKGQMSDYVTAIQTRLILPGDAALRGAAACIAHRA